VSVVFGLLSGAVSVATGLSGHSLSVLAVGLGVLADVTGSTALIWRFSAERRLAQPASRETRAATIVAAALAVVGVVLIAESSAQSRSPPPPSR
jgi:hypothetical protein